MPLTHKGVPSKTYDGHTGTVQVVYAEPGEWGQAFIDALAEIGIVNEDLNRALRWLVCFVKYSRVRT